MANWSGLGGGITVNGGIELPVTRHTVRKTSRNTETTHSGNTATNFDHIIGHYEWEAETPFDDTRMVDVDEGLVEGAKVAIKFEDGGSGKFLTLTNTIVETVEEIEDVLNDVLRYRVTGKGGTLTRQVT